MRWIEEVELLEEEYWQFICGLDQMSAVWSNMAQDKPSIKGKYIGE